MFTSNSEVVSYEGWKKDDSTKFLQSRNGTRG